MDGWGWHQQLDDEIAGWITSHPQVTERRLMNYLRSRYSQPDLLARIPEGF